MERAKEWGDCAVFTLELFVSTADDIYGLLGLANWAAFLITSLEGEALTRPILKPFFVGSDISLSTMVSEPTDFESRMMLLT